MRKQVTGLGKKLSELFAGINGDNGISQWISHYIAEQLVISESAKGKRKQEAERNCFQAILTLWEYRASFPNGMRPFDKFEPVFNTLKSLDLGNGFARYFNDRDLELESSPRELNDLLKLAKGVDDVAKVIIYYLFEQATKITLDEEIESWLSAQKGLINPHESRVIFNFVTEIEDQENDQQKLKRSLSGEIGRLKSKREKLEIFEKLATDIKQLMINEENDLQQQLSNLKEI